MNHYIKVICPEDSGRQHCRCQTQLPCTDFRDNTTAKYLHSAVFDSHGSLLFKRGVKRPIFFACFLSTIYKFFGTARIKKVRASKKLVRHA